MSIRKMELAVTLLIIITFILTGCKSNMQSIDDESQNDGINSGEAEFVYNSEYLPFPIGTLADIDKEYIKYNSGFTCSDSKVYFYIKEIFEWEAAGCNAYAYSMNLDGSEFVEFTDSLFPVVEQPDAITYKRIDAMTADNDGNLWVAVQWYYILDIPENYDTINGVAVIIPFDKGYKLRKINPDGEELLSIDLDIFNNNFKQLMTIFSVDTITVQSCKDDKYIYLGNNNISREDNSSIFIIRVLGTTGDILFENIMQANDAQFITMSDGTVAILVDSETLYSIDIPTGNITEISGNPISALLPSDIRVLASGNHYDCDIIAGNSDGLYAVNINDKKTDRLLNWTDSKVNPDYISEIIVLPGGRIACLNKDIPISLLNTRITILSNTFLKSYEFPETIELTLAGICISPEIQKIVSDYNKVNRNYHINIIDYLRSDSFNLAALAAGIERLNTDIISGNVPDILYTDNIPYEIYAESGLFTDLYPFIEADPELDRTDFLQGPLLASEYNGKLYRAFSGFSISTIIGNPAVLGKNTQWDLDEFEAVLNANPKADIPIGDMLTGSDFLKLGAIQSVINDFINKEVGTSSFDSPQFVKLLTLTKRVCDNSYSGDPGNYTDIIQAVGDGRQIMEYTLISGFDNYNQKTVFGPDIVIKGFPCSTGNGHIYKDYANPLSIIDSSPNKAAAWSFIRVILSEQCQYMNRPYLFTSNRAAFEQITNDALNSKIGYVYKGEIYLMVTENDVDMILNLVNSDVKPWINSDTMYDIIIEEANRYFNDVTNVETAAKFIQSRVSLYLAEQST